MRFTLAIVAAVVVAWPTPSARACSLDACSIPAVYPLSGSLPANMRRLRLQQVSGPLPTPRLYRLEGSTKISVAFNSEPIDGSSSWIEPTVAQ
jgi:hypothetical protein